LVISPLPPCLVTVTGNGGVGVGCDLDEKASAETVEMVTAAGGRMAALAPVDLASAEGARAWAGAAVAEFGGVDIPYNNASALRNGPLMALSDEDWHFTITNELDIVWFSVRAAWPEPVARGGGSIINVASIAARFAPGSSGRCRTARPRAGCSP
jgi:NAD(P)-dependent dehydrogenase (short-subunit alcohol dehydrogenase family)